MLRRAFLAFCLSLWVSAALAQSVPKPGAKDLCPVCGMIVSKYPNWVAVVSWKDGHNHFFDGAKDLFKFLHDLAKYAPGHRQEEIAGIYVTDFYNLEKIDARRALFVAGSDVLGPMGHEFVPLANQADADDFMKDHKGRRIYTFKQIGATLPGRLDDGKFD
ncbi:MAG: nitrous oxide reductase accessory protein NosL [Azonexus sp.]